MVFFFCPDLVLTLDISSKQFLEISYTWSLIMKRWNILGGCTVVWWLAPSPHSKRVPGSNPSWGLSVWSLHVLESTEEPKNMHVRLIGDSKMSQGVSVSMDGCLCVALQCTGDLSRVYPASCPMTAGLGSRPPVFISGPLLTLNRGVGHFSRLLGFNTCLQYTCKALNVDFIDNFNLFWNRPSFFMCDGLHPNQLGSCVLRYAMQ